ncbi:hypothetical protein CMT48_12035 [Elizabethkingia anophelis]|uniref:Uncharacterized protein n=1 Tax=Elizabethkingia anophelis R26 TaxID=1246994 RepID=A0ABN5BUI6_9FLAO|nr:hypothetical protein A2T74_15870 [Elizabethkingia anophelis]ATC37270.1 hypothetical protein BAZ09_014010 [Elizabethkingia anophelis R26]ATC40948.1 hypothetical protein EAAG1_014225 [Elizabethkingia anophelis Ag1]AMX49380.1 hypothetical protein A4C56_15870 [Elizabethkingia anophelis]AMX52835.1 hypothetical protein A2T72_15865 [Elizabethkingia anophelis]
MSLPAIPPTTYAHLLKRFVIQTKHLFKFPPAIAKKIIYICLASKQMMQNQLQRCLKTNTQL